MAPATVLEARAVDRRSGRSLAAAVALVALGIVHLLGCLYYFPPSEMLSGEPAMTSDYGVQYLSSLDAARNLRGGSFLGYSTRWAAGTVSGFPSLASNRPYSLILAVTPDRYAPLVFNLSIFAALWLAPLVAYGAARAIGSTATEATLAAALFVASWYGSSFLRLYWRAGSVVFVLSAMLAVWIGLRLPAIWRSSPGIGADLRAAALIGLAGWLHSLCSIVVAIVGGAAWLTMERGERRPISRLIVTGVVGVVLWAPWLLEFAESAPIRRSLDYGVYLGGMPALLFDLFYGWVPARWQRGQLTVILPLLLLALSAGAFVAPERRRSRRGLWLAVGAFALLAYFAGYASPLRSLQPYRFVIPMMAILVVLAVPLAHAAPRWRAHRVAAVVAVVALVLLGDRVRVGLRANDYIGAGLGPADRWALQSLRTLAAPQGEVEGRILLEGDWRSEPVPDRHGGVRVSYTFVGLAKHLDAEFIGAPAMATGLRTEYASFWVGKLFGRPIVQYDEAAFRALCDLYDIRWVLTHRSSSRRHLESLATLASLRAVNAEAAIFEIDRIANRVLSGPGRVTGRGEEIVFETDAAEPSVLKYHWLPALRAEPAAELRPVTVVPGAPVGFIEIRPPGPGRYRIHWPKGLETTPTGGEH